MKTKLNIIDTEFKPENDYCWVQTRAGVFPDGRAIMTSQPLLLNGDDVFYGLSCFFSNDKDKNWTGPFKQPELQRRSTKNDMEIVISDSTPAFHKQSGKMLLTGHTVIYDNDKIMASPCPRHSAYSVFDETTQSWGGFKLLEIPNSDSTFFSCGSGCGQRVDLSDGIILLPVYYMSHKQACDPYHNCYKSTMLRCTFDGQDMEYLEHGNSLSITQARGLYEPSLYEFNGRYFLTLRNDIKGYVALSDDGLNYCDPIPWCFDDGKEIGNYNTQQHWLSIGDKLYLVYTRKGASNDHVFRHRGPLFIAQVDTKRLCLIKKTEQIIIPERGARMGNFGCLQVNKNEAWVVVSEWMQNATAGFGRAGVEHCMKYGSNNSILIAKVHL